MQRTFFSATLFFLLALCVGSCGNKIPEYQSPDTIQFLYMAYACECAQWIDVNDLKTYKDDDLAKEAHCVYIEPATDSVKLPDTLGWMGDVIEFTGTYYIDKGYPKGFKTDQPAQEARVFRYSSYKIIELNRSE